MGVKTVRFDNFSVHVFLHQLCVTMLVFCDKIVKTKYYLLLIQESYFMIIYGNRGQKECSIPQKCTVSKLRLP